MLFFRLRVLAPKALRARGEAGISSERSSSRRSGMSEAPGADGEAAGLRLEEGLAAGLGEVAHAQDVALPLGDGDDAARVEQVEGVGGLDALIVGRQHHAVRLALRPLRPGFEQGTALLLRVLEMAKQD